MRAQVRRQVPVAVTREVAASPAGRGALTPAHVQRLQAAIGNRRVAEVLGGASGGDLPALQRWDLLGGIAAGISSAIGAVSDAVKGIGKVVEQIVDLVTPDEAFVRSSECLLRSAPPALDSYGVTVPVNTRVKILKTAKVKEGKKTREYALITEIVPDDLIGPVQYQGWTRASNLTRLDTPVSYGLAGDTQRFADAVLKKVGKDPKAWFADFTHTSFLGRHTATPVHRELADQLKKAEGPLVAAHSGGTGNPAVAGDNLGLAPELETIKGARKEATSASRSMHFFGLAIDLDYTANPYITESENDREALAEVLPRASLLVTGTAKSFPKGGETDPTAVDVALELDATLETYFSYLDDDAALERRLEEAASAGTRFWKDKDVASARKRIREDLTWLVGVWRAKRGTKSFTELVKKGGFTNFSRALVDGIGLHWGGTYGDMMHFDMRNTGTGEAIAKARHQVKAPGAGAEVES